MVRTVSSTFVDLSNDFVSRRLSAFDSEADTWQRLNTTYKLALVLAVTNKAGEIPFLNNSPLKREGFLRPSTDFSTRSDPA